MFLSNEHFVNTYLTSSTQEKDFLRYFMLIRQVIKKYGKRSLDMDVYLESIKKHSPQTHDLILLLKKLNKLDIKDITQIVNLLKKKYATSKKEFMVAADKNMQTQLGSFVTDTFKNVDLDSQDSSKVGIDVKGEGYRYKRDLDRDLNLLLG